MSKKHKPKRITALWQQLYPQASSNIPQIASSW